MKEQKGLAEFWRKRMVALKRKPQIPAMLVLVVGFLWYSLNLTYISNTTARVQGPGMGLAGFGTMLFSILSLVCFLNTYPHRKPTNQIMLCLTLGMLALLVFCDAYYLNRINIAVTRAENAIDLTVAANSFIKRAKQVLQVHQIILIIGAALQVLLPVYRPLIKKINTSIEVEGNGEMAAIDLNGEE